MRGECTLDPLRTEGLARRTHSAVTRRLVGLQPVALRHLDELARAAHVAAVEAAAQHRVHGANRRPIGSAAKLIKVNPSGAQIKRVHATLDDSRERDRSHRQAVTTHLSQAFDATLDLTASRVGVQ